MNNSSYQTTPMYHQVRYTSAPTNTSTNYQVRKLEYTNNMYRHYNTSSSQTIAKEEELDPVQKKIKQIEENTPSITIINMNSLGIGNRGAKALAMALQSNTNTVILFLDNNEITSSGLYHLANSIVTHPTLKYIYLSYNYIGNVGATYLANAFTLHKQTMQQECFLIPNDITKSSDGPMLQQPPPLEPTIRLPNNIPTIQVLKLSHNGIGTIGAVALMESLPSSVHTVALDGNAITDDGIQQIAEIVRSNTSLRNLDVRYNAIMKKDECLKAFCSISQTDNRTLSVLELDQNDWTMYSKKNTSKLASLPNEDEELETQLFVLLRLNGIGRQTFGTTSIESYCWSRLLSKVTYGKKNWCPNTTGTTTTTDQNKRDWKDPIQQNEQKRTKQIITTPQRQQEENQSIFIQSTTQTNQMILGNPNLIYSTLLSRPDLLTVGVE